MCWTKGEQATQHKEANVAMAKGAVLEVVANGVDEAAEETEQPTMDDVIADNLEVRFGDIVDGDIVPDNQGRLTVELSGTIAFYVHQGTDDDGNIVYTSDLFKSTQDELMNALRLGCTNAARRAFKSAWERIYPPEPKERKPRESMKAKYEEARSHLDVANQQLVIVAAATKSGRMPTAADFEDAGLPVPEWIS
jgi:hypothetical protein